MPVCGYLYSTSEGLAVGRYGRGPDLRRRARSRGPPWRRGDSYRGDAAPQLSEDIRRGRSDLILTPGGKFTPGTGGAGVVEAVGDGVYHLAVGQAVLLSPYLTADERVPDPASTLISLHGDPQLNQMWRDGTLADKALMPASVVTPIPPGTGDAVRVTALTRCLVPYGGLVKGRLRPGETVVMHGDGGLRAGRRTSRLGDGRCRGRGRRAKPSGLGRTR